MHFGDYLNIYIHPVFPLTYVKPIIYLKRHFFMFCGHFNSSDRTLPINRWLKKLQTEAVLCKPVILTSFHRGKSTTVNVIEKICVGRMKISYDFICAVLKRFHMKHVYKLFNDKNFYCVHTNHHSLV